MIQPRPLLALKLLLFTWFFVHYTVQAFTLTLGVPNDKTVTSARCFANCLTLTSSVNNETQGICNSPACQECLRPCDQQRLDDHETDCISSCDNSTMCVASCRFITAVRNFTSIRDGDGSVPSTPDIPTVKDMNVSSVTLGWPPVLNKTSGTPVYLIGMTYSGDGSSPFPFYFLKVFTENRATLSVGQVCSVVYFTPTLPRSRFQGILFKFRVAVLTENSSISYGQFTTDIILPKPQPVSNVTLEGFAFDPTQAENKKLAVHSSWTPPDQEKQVVTKYTMLWDDDSLCLNHGLPVVADNNGPQPNGTLYLNEKLTKCMHTLTVYAMISCTASDPVSLNYEYPGCINVTNYPRDLCYKYDPPPSPLEERQVNNISYRVVSTEDDYTFNINLTWKPPVYPYREVEKYIISWQEILPTDQVPPNTNAESKVTHILLAFLLPAVNYSVNLQPVYKDENPLDPPLGAVRLWTFSTPAPDPNEVQVQNLTFDEFNLTGQTGTFSLNVSWQKPPFNYSEISKYAYSYQLGQGTEKVSTTNNTHFTIPSIVHGEPISFKITPIYKHTWIKGTEIKRETAAPKPLDERNRVTELVVGTFLEDQEDNTYSVEFTWALPLFKFSKVTHYNLAYELSGYPHDHLPCRSSTEQQMCTETGVKERQFTLSGIRPREFIRLEVVPVYVNKYITGNMRRIDQTAPEPREELVKVVGLERGELIPNAKGMFNTTIKWQKPLFKHSDVKYYQYNTTVSTDPQRRRRSTAASTRSTTKNTTVNLHGIERDKEYTFEVTPVFNADAVTGRTEKLSISFETSTALASKDSLSGAEVAGLVIGLLVALLLVTSLLTWWFKERQKRKKKAQGLVFGKNGLMIDDWEVATDKVSLEKELGEGAFGKVYQGFLKLPPESSQKRHLKSSMMPSNRQTIKQCEGFIVAVKMLHDMADSDQRREFLQEIQLMKDVGCHRNIVNMIGCCTIEEPMFLLVEYLPYGDLLHYLRKHRGKVKEYLGDESRGPYRSTYCETYIADSTGGRVIKATRNDRTYVNSPESPREDNGNIQLLTYSSLRNEEDKDINGENMNHFYVNSEAMQEEDTNEDRKELADGTTNVEEEEEETLSPGDLMAFAWQISQGMEYLAKKGFVHRDLAARNVLVGENKIAKVADFGLTRHVYEEKVYHAKHNRKLPLKWMSIEAIFDETFTSQSDVWAFGIVMWELVTLGGTPYPSINNRELLRLLKEGYRMEKPETCNDELFDLMRDCWKETPNERPNFTLVREKLEQMMQKNNPYLDFSALDEGKEYYHVPSFNSLMDESTDQVELDDRDDTELLNNKQEESKESKQTELEGMVPQIEEKDIRETLGMPQHDTSKNTMDSSEPTNAKISISDIEMNLYRPGKRGLVF